jgi:hypothetical protein
MVDVDQLDNIIDLQEQTLDRVTRVETRLVQLMLYVGADPTARYGTPQPKKETQHAETEARSVGDTSHRRP